MGCMCNGSAGPRKHTQQLEELFLKQIKYFSCCKTSQHVALCKLYTSVCVCSSPEDIMTYKHHLMYPVVCIVHSYRYIRRENFTYVCVQRQARKKIKQRQPKERKFRSRAHNELFTTTLSSVFG